MIAMFSYPFEYSQYNDNIFVNILKEFKQDMKSNFPIEDKKSVNLHYVGGFHLNDVKELRHKVNDSQVKSHGKPSKVIINLDYCEEILTLLDDIVNIFIDVIKDVTNKLEGKNKVNFIYNCHLKENGDNSDNFSIAHIPIMQEELIKGGTKVIITNCGFSRMIEAFAYNIQVICLPDLTDLIKNAKAKELIEEKGKQVINADTGFKSKYNVAKAPAKSSMKTHKKETVEHKTVNFGQTSGSRHSPSQSKKGPIESQLDTATTSRMGEIQEEGYDSDKEVPKRFSCFGFRCKRGVDGEDSFNLKYDEIVANIEMIDGTFAKDKLVQVLMDMLTTDK
uniref:Uncharacterized protein n=1 Tax=Meloidogyne javanica TaxID=6303 RepID=A0A915LQL1_MELJA